MHEAALRMSILGAFVLLACGSEAIPAEPVASARFELESGTDNGNVFQLRDAVFELTGPTNTSVTSAGIGRWVSVDVKPGTYSILLKPGWSLHHISGPGDQFDTSEARLLSENPRTVVLPAGQTTDVVFSFALGDYVIGKGEARARIGIDVAEPLCGNGKLDPGEECDVAIKYSGATCDSKCTGGFRPCSKATDCASGICDRGNCNCEATATTCKQSCFTNASSCTNTCAGTAEDCSEGCISDETTCRNICGKASEACWLGCFFDPIACSATCEPPRAVCMAACTSAKNSCSSSCTSTFNGCAGTCTSTRDTCTSACDTAESSCQSSCNRCKSCTEAGQCPYEK